MFLIKQSIITTIILHKIINYIKKSPENASNIGKEISLYYNNVYYYHSYNNSILPIAQLQGGLSKNTKDTIKIYNSVFYHLINQLNTKFQFNISLKYILFINSIKFFNKFNHKLYKLNKSIIYSYFRGYYINNLYLYSTNINIKNIRSNINHHNNYLYFVLYDFKSTYLEYIYKDIISSIDFYPKIKFLLNTYIDKYSINDLTDNIPYKLVFLHKTKYYHNIISILLSFLFYGINDTVKLQKEENELFQLYDLISF